MPPRNRWMDITQNECCLFLVIVVAGGGGCWLVPWCPSFSFTLANDELFMEGHVPGGELMGLHWAGFSNASTRTYLPEHIAIKKQNSIGNNGLELTECNNTEQRGHLISKVSFGNPTNAWCNCTGKEDRIGFSMRIEFWILLLLNCVPYCPAAVPSLCCQSWSDSQSVTVAWEVIIWVNSLVRLGCYLP